MLHPRRQAMSTLRFPPFKVLQASTKVQQVLKCRFPNLTALEAASLASDMVVAVLDAVSEADAPRSAVEKG